ncbi:hypothetical protein niasHS_013787 [Heterodera schachtii]|uniref:Ankyrin repeat domain-containing protein n=1 Tax=Heterodera schachtii TaxID=97005 RepID=A0ABD2IS52_HETSC
MQTKCATTLLIAFLLFVSVQCENKNSRVDLEITDNEGKTAIFHAAQGGNVEITTLLIDHGARVDRTDKKGNSVLHDSVLYGNFGVTELFLKSGAKANLRRFTDGHTALHIACQLGRLDIVKLLVEKGGADIEIAANDGSTPLAVALRNEHIEIADYLQTKQNHTRHMGKTNQKKIEQTVKRDESRRMKDREEL